jgi:serine/threonine protein kinase/tetratricopeptide (TPR) repeat protein
MGEIVDEFLQRLSRDERPEVEEYARRYPQLATVLRHMLPMFRVMHSSAADQSKQAEEPAAAFEPEGPLGDFRIVREIGRGGMGIVYEAVQISLGRRVALKVLPFAAALDAKQLQRFKNEAQAAAHLHHQNIVPVYAVGSERGVHYYAMQFIEGQSLAQLIRDLRFRFFDFGEDDSASAASPSSVSPPSEIENLKSEISNRTVVALSTLRSTVEPGFFRIVAGLAVQASRALEHAHSRGVVHRDIKPANLLIDGQGNLWVTDFGLAQVQTDSRLTLTGDLVGTLRYMSPEQALAHPIGVDYRTDIYSLGTTLYELLTLQPAFSGRDRQELLRQIASEEPKPPRRVNRTVPVELETIVLKAMAKSPAERYATSQELADDLERFLQDEPIRAKRPTLVQRARKWARRHRPVVWSATLALTVCLTVLAGVFGWAVRDRSARQSRHASDLQAAVEEALHCQREGNWPRAQAAAIRAKSLLQDEVTQTEFAERVRVLLCDLADEEADRKLLASLDDIQMRQAELNVKEDRFALPDTLPDYRRAFDEYGLRANVMTTEAGADLVRRRPRAVRNIIVAALDHWHILARYRGAAEARWLEQVLSTADPDPWRQSVRAARRRNDRAALSELAREVDVAVQPPEALFVLEVGLSQRGAKDAVISLLTRAQETFPGDFWINHDLGMALRDCQPPQHAEAIRFLTAATALRPESPGARLNLGNAHLDAGRLDEALAAFRKAVRLKPEYAMAHNNIGVTLTRMGRQEEAITEYRRAIELNPSHFLAHVNLAKSLAEVSRFEEAIPVVRRIVELKPDFVEGHFRLGVALARTGRPDEALAAYRRTIELKPDFAEAHCNVGKILCNQRRLDEAITAQRKAIELKPELAMAHYDLALALAHKDSLDEALAAARRAIELKPDWAEALGDLGVIFWKKHQLDEAAAALSKAIELAPNFAQAHYNLGNVGLDQGRLDEALAAWRQALELNPELAEAHCNLGLVLCQQGNLAPALAALKRGHELGAQRSDWPYASARWVERCQRLADLEDRLPAILQGKLEPANAAEQIDHAALCHCKKRHVAAARMWTSAFRADRRLADDLDASHRYDAACAAAMAGCGRGEDAGLLDDEQRARWRKHALDWLHAELTAIGKLLDSGTLEQRRRIRHQLWHWQSDRDLAGLRDSVEVAKLPADERQACKELWAEVEAQLARTNAR